MQDYTLEKRDSSKQEWVKVHDWVDFVGSVKVGSVSKVVSRPEQKLHPEKFAVGSMGRMVFQTRPRMNHNHIGLRSMAISCWSTRGEGCFPVSVLTVEDSRANYVALLGSEFRG
ncbi:hypothetical protein MLD38_001854 [Melastoma candidum]|uniref:Uncharacterized protein n=1 Tax=Melastoma candidum TaxID=119954 RepID=A0ACB9SGK1_9MYRT|nr:hypothetical protein MLD38_001854 [Melastoma candidum]